MTARSSSVAATAPRSFWGVVLNATVVISALGYFVDIYDLVLFSIVRVASLRSLGVPEAQLLPEGVFLLNMQMTGMLLGGILWGVLGDRRGRVSVLFGSILLYSLANIANAFATTVPVYGVMRLLAGIGLAGELGAAVTLVSESLPKESRGIGTSFVAGIGVSGAMLAAFIAQSFSWQTAFIAGGVMGLALLVLRVRLLESGLYAKLDARAARRGDLLLLLAEPRRLVRYLRCILIGMPTWYVVGILITFSPEICRELGATGPVSAGTGILCNYAGLVFGDLGSGALSQVLKSRHQVVALFAAGTAVLAAVFVLTGGMSPTFYYGLSFALGLFAGYWALFVTIAAEQFGTNLRATVATTAPNFVRGSVVLLTMLLQLLKTELGLARSALAVGAGCFAVTFLALWHLPESFGKDLDFVEGPT
jgi:MFS family permease